MSQQQTMPQSATSCHSSAPQHPARRRAGVAASTRRPRLVQKQRQQVKSANETNESRPTSMANFRLARRPMALLLCATLIACLATATICRADEQPAKAPAVDGRATQPSIERQLDTPAASATSTSAAAAPVPAPAKPARVPYKPTAAATASQKRAAASLASSTSYDKYQLKASPSVHSATAAAAGSLPAAPSAAPATSDSDSQKEGKNKEERVKSDTDAGHSTASHSSGVAHKKAGQPQKAAARPSSFALLKKFLPSFMTAGSAVAAAAAAASSSAADKPTSNQHSRSSSPSTSSSALFAHLTGEGPLNYASGKLVGLLAAKKRHPLTNAKGEPLVSAIPNSAPFFVRKAAVDRQAVGGGAMAGLLANPLKLGLLFSAPLLPSLLLTPLAIAGLSPAMSAINNFFGDDDDEQAQQSSSPLAALASGPNSPLASILQATGVAPLPTQAANSPSDSSSSSSATTGSSAGSGNLALQAFQSLFLGPSSTTERPLFNPGMFASSGIGNAMGSLASSALSGSGSSSSSSASTSGGSSLSSGSSRPGGSFLQTAASMISPSFAAPPGNSDGSNSDSDGPGLMQMASDVFEKVATFMGNENGNKDIGQASGATGASSSGSAAATGGAAGAASSSPLATLASLSSLSPFQLSSLFAPTAFGSAVGQASSTTSGGHHAHGGHHAAGAGHTHRAGFLSTLRNVYELFSSSFLRRQEVGDANECQQRLVCELHQRAMNSKLFRRSLQTNLAELANLDRNLLEQLKLSSQTIQARVDPDTKAMLSDFLKASSNFKSGRELVNCGQMFPKCSRAQLLVAANAHLNDPANGRTISKFSQLMKKMKFKSAQQHQSQWKLRKPNASKLATAATQAGQQPAGDYLQVAPLAATGKQQRGALAPVDSLKLAQQLMMLSQMNQPQAQQQQINSMAASQFAAPLVASAQQQPQAQYRAPSNSPPAQMFAAQQPQLAASQHQQEIPSTSFTMQAGVNSFPPLQYSQAPQQARQTTYTDAIAPPQPYATEAPYFVPPPPQQQQQQAQYQQPGQQVDQMTQYAAQQKQAQQQYQSSYQNYAPTSQVVEQPQQPIANQQQQANVQIDNSKPQSMGAGAGAKIAMAA